MHHPESIASIHTSRSPYHIPGGVSQLPKLPSCQRHALLLYQHRQTQACMKLQHAREKHEA